MKYKNPTSPFFFKFEWYKDPFEKGFFSSGIRLVNLHPSKGTLWVCYISENSFDS